MRKKIQFCLLLGLILRGADVSAQLLLLNQPVSPKVNVTWNRLLDHAGINAFCLQLAEAYPDLVKLETIGDSYGGRRMVALVVSDFNAGDPDRKPALYMDGNIYANKLQGAEYALYVAWYLAESRKDNAFIKELLQQKTFYILPTTNPDGLDALLHNSLFTDLTPKKSTMPQDDDGDGLMDEDEPEDLNGDGFTTFMRRKSNTGKYISHPDNPKLLILSPLLQNGDYEFLGYEGKDTDEDGRVNEDPSACADPSYDWAWNWQPNYLQPGALKYPFSLTETRQVKDFVLRHPNIAAAQSFHPAGNELAHLARQESGESLPPDLQVYTQLSQQASRLIPGTPYQINWVHDFAVFGSQLSWFQWTRGVFTFSTALGNEVLSVYQQSSPEQEMSELPQRWHVLHSYAPEAFVEWTPFEHPLYGNIEIGGYKKGFLPPAIALLKEEEFQRHLLYAIYHGYQTPQLDIKDVKTRLLENGLTEVTATIQNNRLIPTHSRHDLQHRIERPDYVTLKDSTVTAGFVIDSLGDGQSKEQIYLPHKLEVRNVPGKSSVKVKWLVRAQTPNLEIEVDSRKGGVVCTRF